jgi:hypothetical protein
MNFSVHSINRFFPAIVTVLAVSAALGQTVPMTHVLQCEYFSARQGGFYPDVPAEGQDRNSVQYLGTGNWLRYDSVNFTTGVFDSVVFRNAGFNANANIRKAHLKLGSPTGADLAVFDMRAYGWSDMPTKALSTKLTGYQTLCLTFEGGDSVCWIADYLKFRGTATYNASEASTYYVAPNGDDGNNGLSLEKPFKTIQRAANVMKPGSVCNIRQGVYRETVCPQYTGLSAGAQLVFQAYNNEQVFIDGADPVTGWTKYSGNIYKTTMPWSLGKYKNQLMVDGKSCVVARAPNIDDPWNPPQGSEFLFPTGLWNWTRWQKSGEIDPFLCPSRVFFWRTDSAEPISYSTLVARDAANDMPDDLYGKPADYFKGGLLSIQSNWWVNVCEIKHSRCDIGYGMRRSFFNFDTPINALIMGQNGIDKSNKNQVSFGPGYISYLLCLLNEPNEWFRDSNGTVYLWAPDGGDPSHHLVEGKRRLAGFDLTNKSYVTLKGLRFICTSATLAEATHCTIDDCHWKYASYYDAYQWYEEFCGPWMNSPYDPSNGWSGVFIGGAYNTVKNSSSIISAGSGFISSGRGHHLFTNNIIHDCNWLPTYNAGIRQFKRDQSVLEDCGGNLYEYNTIRNCGRATIELELGSGFRDFIPIIPSERNRIMHNDLGRAGYLANEAFVTWNHGDNYVEYAYNRFWGGGVSGGYIEADPAFGGWGTKVHHNVFYNGRPINDVSPSAMKPIVNYALIQVDTNTTFFNNTIVDSAACSRLQEDDWLWPNPGHYKPWFQANNIFGWSDTVKWKYTDAPHGDYTLRAGSPAIDAGVVIPDWLKQFPAHARDDMYQSEDDSYEGKAPDLGAFEYGKPAWRAGANWQEKPWVYPPPLDPGALIGAQRLSGILAPRLRIGPRALILNAPAGTAYTVMLYNMQGAVVLTRNLPKGGMAVVPTSGISAGMYALRLHVGNRYVAQWKVCIRR